LQVEAAIMTTAKQSVTDMLDKLPDDSSFEEIQYHLSVLQKVKQGLDDVELGKTCSHSDVERRMKDKWLK